MAFHPYTRLIRTICTSAPVRSSTSLSGGFNLAAHRSTGFGSPDDDLRRSHLAPRARGTAGSRFRSGFGIAALTSPSPGTPWPVFRNVRQDAGHTPFHALPACSRLVSGSFHLPLRGTFQLSVTLLVRYRSRDVFRVGSLCLPPSRAISDARYSGTSGLSLLAYPYGAITLYGVAFQPTSGSPFGSTGVQTPHLPCLSARGSVCPVPFSVAPTHGIAIAFFSCGY